MSDKSLKALLIIDDDESLRDLLCLLLESQGYLVLPASDSEEALKLLREDDGSIRGALLDLNLNNAKGEDLYDDIVALSPDIAIFPMSGCHSDEILERFEAKSIGGVISKPFRSSELFQIISSGIREKDNLSSERI